MSSNCEKFSARLGSPSGPFTGTRLSPIQEDKKKKIKIEKLIVIF